MKLIKYLFVPLISLFLISFAVGNANATFTDIGHAGETTYLFDDLAGFTFSVTFDLWQDDGTNGGTLDEYLYTYQITNLDDSSGYDLANFYINYGVQPSATGDDAGDKDGHPGGGTHSPFFIQDNGLGSGENSGIKYWNSIPETETSTWFWMTSMNAPGSFEAGGNPDGGSYTTVGDMPAPAAGGGPIPEPATILLFGVGLIGLAGYGRRKFKK